MPSLFTLEGPQLGAETTEWTTGTVLLPRPPPPKKLAARGPMILHSSPMQLHGFWPDVWETLSTGAEAVASSATSWITDARARVPQRPGTPRRAAPSCCDNCSCAGCPDCPRAAAARRSSFHPVVTAHALRGPSLLSIPARHPVLTAFVVVGAVVGGVAIARSRKRRR